MDLEDVLNPSLDKAIDAADDLRPTFYRPLKQGEQELVSRVFQNTLPPWNEIGIGDGRGPGDSAWTDTGTNLDSRMPSMRYAINVGTDASTDMSNKDRSNGRIGDSALLIHEMTHVWQYYRGVRVKIDSCLNRAIGAVYGYDAYDFDPGSPWINYNVEQQARIVELWHKHGEKDDELFPYVHCVIRTGGQNQKLNAAELQMKLFPVPVEHKVNTTAKDDSLVVILRGDVLFDFDKSTLKREADQPLRQAATTILRSSSANKRLDRVLINGHTDSIGDPGYNMHLSVRRAEAVAKWFSSHGYLPHSILKTQGFGKMQPIAPNSDPTGRAKNRRVAIYVINR